MAKGVTRKSPERNGMTRPGFGWGVAAGVVLALAGLQVAHWARCYGQGCGAAQPATAGAVSAEAMPLPEQSASPPMSDKLSALRKRVIVAYLAKDFVLVKRLSEEALAVEPSNTEFKNFLARAKMKLAAH